MSSKWNEILTANGTALIISYNGHFCVRAVLIGLNKHSWKTSFGGAGRLEKKKFNCWKEPSRQIYCCWNNMAELSKQSLWMRGGKLLFLCSGEGKWTWRGHVLPLSKKTRVVWFHGRRTKVQELVRDHFPAADKAPPLSGLLLQRKPFSIHASPVNSTLLPKITRMDNTQEQLESS